MSDKDLKRINDLAKKELARVNSMTRDEARRKLIDAGILNKKGRYTKPYKSLELAIQKH